MEMPVSLPGRLDAFLASVEEIRSRGHAQELIEAGCVQVNGAVCLKPARHVDPGDIVGVALPDIPLLSGDIEPRDMHLPIVHEDAACIVIDKPAGYAVHPGTGMAPGEVTILHGAAHLFVQRGLAFNPAHVLAHRLDKETTGCLLLAKTPEAHIALQAQFADRSVQKTYLAIVAGVPDPAAATIDAPIGRSPNARTKMSVYGVSHARDARTTYRTLSASNQAALLACDLHTGRTHQIRVHLSSVGYPVIGDDTYVNRLAERLAQEAEIPSLCLHAWKLAFRSPSGNLPISLTVEPPPAFVHAMERLHVHLR